MKKCECGKKLYDFEEHKYSSCWECISEKKDLIENTPNLGSIRDDEKDVSVIVKDKYGTKVKFAVNKKQEKAPPKETTAKTTKEGDEGTTTKKTDGKKPKSPVEDESELKVLRESKEVLTKSPRAKTRAFALINEALKNTGVFEVSATLGDRKMTVSSIPYKERNIEDVVMSTSMEMLDQSQPKKKR